MKESDRLTAVCRMLGVLGGQAEEGADYLTVHGVPTLRGGTVDGCGDHRIVMAAAIAATACTEPVTISGAEAVAKSYPDFFDVYRALGGVFHVI
jgi:3-phosphoshikimate 1-carboxyvinyltransferase